MPRKQTPANLILHQIHKQDWVHIRTDRNGVATFHARVTIPETFKDFDTRRAVFDPAPDALTGPREVVFHATRPTPLFIRAHW